ncbi:MAG: Ig-like domain-containing protein [Sumerlaeia bacterium]
MDEDDLGAPAAGVGDMNGDGRDDVIVGLGPLNRVAVIYGKADPTNVNLGELGSNGMEIQMAETADTLISALAGLGDFDGDGSPDAAFLEAIAPDPYEVRPWIVYGKGDNQAVDLGNPAGEATRLLSPADGGGFTHRICGIGDFNGDGLGDLAVVTDATETIAARVYVVLGRSNRANIQVGSATAQTLKISFDSLDRDFQDVKPAGDFNGDGYDDLLISSLSSTGVDSRIDIVFGGIGTDPLTLSGNPGPRVSVLTGTALRTYQGSIASIESGASGLGDVNGDGYGDLVVAASDEPFGPLNGLLVPGRAAISETIDIGVSANTIFSVSLDDWRMDGLTHLAPLGDWNGDGAMDLLVANSLAFDDDGYTAIVFGKATSDPVVLDTSADDIPGARQLFCPWCPTGWVDQFLGQGVAAMGDANGDGLSDFYVAGPHDYGHAWVFHSDANPPATAAWRTFVRAGNAPRRGIGLASGNALISSPASSIFLDYDGGDNLSHESVTLWRSLDLVSGLPPTLKPAPRLWRLETDRTGWTEVEVTFDFGAMNLGRADARELTLYRADAPEGPWEQVTASLDLNRGLVTATVDQVGYLVIGSATDTLPPLVRELAPALGPNPTNADTVVFQATFTEPVSGVSVSDFQIAADGTLSDAVVSSVSGGGKVWNIEIDTGTGDGSINLLLEDDNSIVDESGKALGGPTLGDGNAGPSLAITVDRTPPPSPTSLILDSNHDTGRSRTDNITMETAPWLRAKGLGLLPLTVDAVDRGELATYLLAPFGGSVLFRTFSIAPLPAGETLFRAYLTDEAGNQSVPIELTVVVDLEVKPGLSYRLDPASDTGTQGDNITQDTTPSFEGTVEPETAVRLSAVGKTTFDSAYADTEGNFRLSVNQALPAGNYIFLVFAEDIAGNKTNRALSATIQQPVLDAPSRPDLAAQSDSGIDDSDNLTRLRRPVLTGQAHPSSTITITSDRDGDIASADADGSGLWNATPGRDLSEGTHQLTAIATAAGFGTSPPSQPLQVIIDATSPIIVEWTPADGAIVSALSEVKVRTDEVFAEVSVGALTVNGTPATGIEVEGALASFAVADPPDGILSLRLEAGALSDAAGNSTSEAVWTVTRNSASPTVSLNSSVVSEGTETSASEVLMRATYSEAVHGFSAAAVATQNASVRSITAQSDTTYEIVISPDADGEVSVTISSAGVTAVAPPNNPAMGSTPIVFTYDTAAPVVQSISVHATAVVASPLSGNFAIAELNTLTEVRLESSRNGGPFTPAPGALVDLVARSFVYTPAEDGSYRVRLIAEDASGNVSPPSQAAGPVIYNDFANSPLTLAIIDPTVPTVFPMSPSSSVTLVWSAGTGMDGPITVERLVGDVFPPGDDPERFLDEALRITGGFSGGEATITWSYDPAGAENLDGPVRSVLKYATATGRRTSTFRAGEELTVAGTTFTIEGINGFSDFYATDSEEARRPAFWMIVGEP